VGLSRDVNHVVGVPVFVEEGAVLYDTQGFLRLLVEVLERDLAGGSFAILRTQVLTKKFQFHDFSSTV